MDGKTSLLLAAKDTVKALLSGWADFFWIVCGNIFFSIFVSAVVIQYIGVSTATNADKDVILFATSVGSSAFYLAVFLLFWPKSWFLSHGGVRSFRVAVAIGALLIVTKWILNRIFDESDLFLALRQNALVVVLVCLIVPFVEEAFFRGLAYSMFLKRSISEFGALGATSLLFVFAHLPHDFNSFIQLCVIAFALGLIRYLSGSIWLGVIVHIIVNIFVLFEL